MAASAALGAVILGAADKLSGTFFHPQNGAEVSKRALLHRWEEVGLLALVGVYLIVVPAVLALLPRGKFPRLRRPGREPEWWGGRLRVRKVVWEESIVAVVVRWMLAATVTVGFVWIMLWLAFLSSNGGD